MDADRSAFHRASYTNGTRPARPCFSTTAGAPSVGRLPNSYRPPRSPPGDTRAPKTWPNNSASIGTNRRPYNDQEPAAQSHTFTLEDWYSATTFRGIMPDTGVLIVLFKAGTPPRDHVLDFADRLVCSVYFCSASASFLLSALLVN